MQVKDEWKQPVGTRDFFVSLAIVVLLLGSMGVVSMQTGHVPTISPLILGGIVLFQWAVAVIHAIRYGKRAFPPERIVFLVGSTLFLGVPLLPVSAAAATVGKNIGAVLLVLSVGMQVLTFKKSAKIPVDGKQ